MAMEKGRVFFNFDIKYLFGINYFPAAHFGPPGMCSHLQQLIRNTGCLLKFNKVWCFQWNVHE